MKLVVNLNLESKNDLVAVKRVFMSVNRKEAFKLETLGKIV